MLKCERCGFEGSENEIKRAPKKIDSWNGKYICINCFLDLKKQNTKKPKIQCPYCGSPISSDLKLCFICGYNQESGKVEKIKKNPKDKKIDELKLEKLKRGYDSSHLSKDLKSHKISLITAIIIIVAIVFLVTVGGYFFLINF